MNKFKIKNIENLKLFHTLDNGQCFRWNALNEEKTKYIGTFYDLVYIISEENERKSNNGNIIDINVISNKNESEITGRSAKQELEYYFDLEKDYNSIKKELRKNPVFAKTVDFGYGLRILKQPIEETIVSFIISANNNIPRIKKSVEYIAKEFGKEVKISDGNSDYVIYTFPELSKLKEIKEQDYVNAKTGFRAKRLEDTVDRLSKEYIESLKNLETNELLEELQKLPGIGPKVANCVSLFAFNRLDTFPIDVWVRRVMQEEFFNNEKVSDKEILNIVKDIPQKGLAQQYIFFWRREEKKGK